MGTRTEPRDDVLDELAWEAFEAGFAAGRNITSTSVRERFERWWDGKWPGRQEVSDGHSD